MTGQLVRQSSGVLLLRFGHSHRPLLSHLSHQRRPLALFSSSTVFASSNLRPTPQAPPTFSAPPPGHQRGYALSRYPRGGRFLKPHRSPPPKRHVETHPIAQGPVDTRSDATAQQQGAPLELAPVDPAIYTEAVIPREPRDVLQQDDPNFEGATRLLGQSALVVTREIEMMNIFLGYEQANRYSILSPTGEQVGFLAEEETGMLGGALQRQLLRTHRPFRATVMNAEGRPVLIIKRPLTWINSKASVYAVRSDYPIAYGPPRDEDLMLIGEVQQRWHLYRRKYDLFLRRPSPPPEDAQADAAEAPAAATAETTALTWMGTKGDDYFEQFAEIDAGLWSWNFMMHDADQKLVGAIDRNFRGFSRELFTDTGQYVLRFDSVGQTDMTDARIDAPSSAGASLASSASASSGTALVESHGSRPLTLDERAVALATAVSIDFDYFSRHSSSAHGGGMFPWFYMGGMGGGGGETTPEGGSPAPTQGGGQQNDGFGTGVVGGAMGQNEYPYGPSDGGSSEGFSRPSTGSNDAQERPWWEQEQDSASGGWPQGGDAQGDVWGGGGADPWAGADDTQQPDNGGGLFGGWGDFFPGGEDDDGDGW
ncbi:hypothetical protein ACQY0O_001973 [Thecaphora frezii]